MTSDVPKLLTANEACSTIGISLEALYRAVSEEKIKSTKLGTRLAIDAASAEEYGNQLRRERLRISNGVSTTTLGKRLGVSNTRVSQLINAGQIKATKYGGHWVIESSEADRFEQEWPAIRTAAARRQTELARSANRMSASRKRGSGKTTVAKESRKQSHALRDICLILEEINKNLKRIADKLEE